ncbi:MAG: hypothetical protein RRY29_07810 [Desulfovibrionaceae bacterium]
MARPSLMDTLTRIAEPVVASCGLEIWGIDILQSGRTVVRIYVDVPLATPASEEVHADASGDLVHEQGPRPSASIEQCASISRMVGLALEVEDIFTDAYVLEVSSPGLSRRFFHLAQLSPFVGDLMELVLNESPEAWPGRKKFTGTLVEVGEHDFTLLPAPLQTEGTPEQEPQTADAALRLTVTWEEVRKIQRVHVFIDPVKPGKKRAESK